MFERLVTWDGNQRRFEPVSDAIEVVIDALPDMTFFAGRDKDGRRWVLYEKVSAKIVPISGFADLDTSVEVWNQSFDGFSAKELHEWRNAIQAQAYDANKIRLDRWLETVSPADAPVAANLDDEAAWTAGINDAMKRLMANQS